jgi:NAD(P)-dependent dehydrogenase (short-subunit alcohol dehydrogenase family)
VNVAGYALMTAEVAPRLEGGGAVVNVASVSAHIAQPSRWTYNAAKGAVVALHRCQAMDLAPRGIRVNSVSPAWVWTPVVQALAGDDADARRREWGAYHLLGRIAEPEEVAAGIAFLASDEARFVNGSAFVMDGGMTAV